MRRHPKQPIFKAAFFVALFWWTVLTLWAAGFNVMAFLKGESGLDWHWTMSALLATAAGIAGGVFTTVFSIWFDRRETAKRLKGQMQHGLECSIGPVPMHLHDLRDPGEEVQSITEDLVSAVPEIEADATTAFLDKWHERYDEQYPAHANLMYAIETILLKYRELPATHVYGGHGGRTLLSHSILVSWYMDKLAPHHTYDGKIKLPDFTLKLPLRRPSYQFDADDPLIALIGLVHDIGKIECYQYDANGKLIGCRADHDSTGVRILARMPEYWDLSSEDREVLGVVVKYYHHPQDTPTEDGELPLDDRLHAMLELLIRADTLASRREAGDNASAALKALEFDADPMGLEAQGNGKEQLWNVILDVLDWDGCINGKDKSTNLGIKRFHPLFKKEMAFLKEDVFIEAICAEMDKENYIPQTSNAVSAMTKVVLRVLDEKGCLYMEQESGGRNPETALYKVEFFPPEKFWTNTQPRELVKDEDRGDPKFMWASTIVIDLTTHFPGLASMEDHKLVPLIRNSRLGAAGKKNAARVSATDIIAKNEVMGTDERVGVGFAELQEKKQADKKRSLSAPTPAAVPSSTSVPTAAPVPAPAVASSTSTHSADERSDNVVPLRPLPAPTGDIAAVATPTAPASLQGGEHTSPGEASATDASQLILWEESEPVANQEPTGETAPAQPVAPSEGGKQLTAAHFWLLHASFQRDVGDNKIAILNKENGHFVITIDALRAWLKSEYGDHEINELIRLMKAGEIPESRIQLNFAFIRDAGDPPQA
jgi:hypothetical protein